MNIFGIHICADEIMAASYAVPYVGYSLFVIKNWFNRVFRREKPCECVCHDEKEHNDG